jgi:glycosyltransferase involved in cell wall biosynthesis
MFTRIASIFQSTTLLNLALKIRTRQIKKIIRQEQCDAIIACTSDLFDPPAGLVASKDLGIPFIFYAFDYYSSQGGGPLLRSFAAKYELDLVKTAANVIVPNEYMYEEYLKRYGVAATILHNPFDIKEYEKQAQIGDVTNTDRPTEKTIVYTGAIYDAHYDAFRNLIAAVKLLGTDAPTIHLYTPQSHHHLINNNITGSKVIVHKALPASAMPSIQRNADILFLPLAFESGYPDIIRTSAPGKTGEYLASGNPILVHAPKDTFVSWFFKKYNCGLVVDENSPELLAQAIKLLITDEKFCLGITQNAYTVAKTQFDIQNIEEKFHEMLNALH